MKFDYTQNIIESIKLLWKNQSLFWAAVVSFFVMFFITLVAGAVTTVNQLGFGTSYGPSIMGAGFILLIQIVFSVFFIAGTFGAMTKIVAKKKVDFNDFFSSGMKYFMKFLAYMAFHIVVFLPVFVIYSFVIAIPTMNKTGAGFVLASLLFIIVGIFYSFWLSMRLLFMPAAIASGKTLKESIKESFFYKKGKRHQRMTFGSLIIASIVITVAYLILFFILLIITNVFFLFTGFPILIAVMVFLEMALYLALMKAYKAKGA